ncbi:glycosyltransferase [Novosphingobium sp.]|uniref:glycosyltransferase n=1 Tax=Novosphingobium sp. TaxID=1874826 RepID=UPI003BAC9C1D
MALKVAFLIPGFSDGGAQRQCVLLLNALQADPDLDLRLIHFYDGVHFDLLRHDRLSVQRFDSGSNYDPRKVWRVWRALRRDPPEVLMTWLHACDVYGYALHRLMPDMAWVMTERDSAYPNEMRYNLRRKLGRYADVIVANSVKGAAYWQAAGATCPIETVPNIVLVGGSEAPALPPVPRVVTIGRLEPQKNPRTVVEAFAMLATEHTALDLAVIGGGAEEPSLKALAAAEGAGERIEFMGFRKDVPDQLANSTIVVSMSHNEGLPNVLLETVAAGRLVVVSDIPEHRELFGPDYPHYVAQRTDPSAVAAAVNRALRAPGEARHLAYARARLDMMKPEIVADRYRSIITSVAEHKK